MKQGVLIVNTARGPLIDEAALIAALDAGKVGGAALDVVTVEPLAKDSPLLNRDNVILTPHIGFYSVEALQELQTKAATDVARVLNGGSRSIRSAWADAPGRGVADIASGDQRQEETR